MKTAAARDRGARPVIAPGRPMPDRDWRLEARRLLSESCERHLSDEQIRSGGRRSRAACMDCLADALTLVYRAGIVDAARSTTPTPEKTP